MTWLYSIFIAGLMFSNGITPPVHADFIFTKSNALRSVKLDEIERFEQTYPLSSNGKIRVSNINGSIKIEAWDRSEVKLEAVKIADSRERLSEFSVKINSQPDYLEIQTEYERQNNRQYGKNQKTEVQYRLTVPQNAVLDEIETVNGEISISNMINTTKASAVNGKVIGLNLQGTAKLSTVNGTVEADFDRLQTSGRISLDTVNGTVNLSIPSDANATIKADTVNGTINNEFGLPVRKGKYVGSDLYGRIGSGDVQIKLSSVNGGLSVKRKNDGKNVNPATNLLPAKNSVEDDWNAPDGDENFRVVRPPKPPIVPPTPLPPDFGGLVNNAEMQKKIDKALKEAQKEMGRITPEMRKQIEDELKKANVNLNTEEMREQMKLAQEKYKQAMAQMSGLNWWVGSPVIEKKSDSFAVKTTPNVTIEANKCAVSVRGWDKPEVHYSITKIGKNINQTPINVQASQTGADVNIKVVNDAETSPVIGANNTRLEIFVPKKLNLKIVTDGEIRLEGISGEIDLKGIDGEINVRDSEGNMRMTASDGKIRVLGFKGEIYAQSADGDVNLEGDFQKLTARTETGLIILTLPEEADANLTANKEITSEGLNLTKEKENNWHIGKGGADFRLQTTDGKIFLRSAAVMKSN